MDKLLRFVLCISLVLLVPLAVAPALAAVPQTLNYQGSLLNGASQPVDAPAAAPLQMTFKFFTALTGGAALYSEQQAVVVKNGVFNVQIGSTTPLTLPFDVPYFLEITIGAEVLNPRQPLASAAYALRSGCAPGDKVFCYTSLGTPGVGPCQNGLRTCNAQGTGYGPCVGEVGPNCGSVCANLQNDPTNCGSCGFACPTPANSTPTCTGAACGFNCNAGAVNCGGSCANLASDQTNCGSCGTRCATGGSCTSGTCSCPAGNIVCSGACVNSSNDATHCGSCATVCVSGATCNAGACACAAGTTLCASGCASLSTSVTNCGTCGTHCATGGSCTGGTCSCPAGNIVCGGTCVNPSNDATHCGSCGTVCTVGHACISGVCN